MNLKRMLLAWALVGALVAPAFAQPAPQFGVLSGVQPKATYHAVALALPTAASATDVACIAGSASRTIRIQRITVTGTTATVVTVPVTLVRRVTLNTGGTAGTTTANWANTVSRSETTQAAHTATLISYAANPTINDANPTYLRSAHTTFVVTTASTVIVPLFWEFGNQGIGQNQFPTIRNGQTTQQICVNFNGITVATPLIHLSIEWTEE